MELNNYNSISNLKLSNKLTNLETNSNLANNKNDASFWIKEIQNLNKELKLKNILKQDKFNSQILIQKALKIGQSFTEKNNTDNNKKNKKNELIKEIKAKAKTNYITNESEKNKKNLNEEFQEILDKCNDKTRIKLDKYFDDLINLKNEQTKIIFENENLESQIESINNESKFLKQRLNEKNEEINKIIKSFDSFNKIKPFFQLIRQYPDKDPRQIMKEFLSDKENIIEQLNKLNKANEDIEDINKLRNQEQIKQNIFREDITEKINQKKEVFENKNLLLEQDILDHERQFQTIQKNNERIMKHKNILFLIYNAIKKYIPENNYNLFLKEIGYNPINSEQDFDPSIFSDMVYINLIRDCIINKASKSLEGKLLRNTIVFGNYLARKYLELNNKNENDRFNPLKIFQNIKLFYDKLKNKNQSLKGKYTNLRLKLENLFTERKNLEKDFYETELKYKKIIDKVELSRKEKPKNNKLEYDNIFEENEKNQLFKKKKKIKSLSKEKIIEINDNNNDKNLFEHSPNVNKKDKFFITDVNKFMKRKKIKFKYSLSIGNYEQNSKNILNNNTMTAHSNYKKFRFNKNILKLKNFINLKEHKLSLSKNKDKIFKNNGIKGGHEIYPNIDKLIKLLIENENFDIFNIKSKKNKLKIETSDLFHLNTSNLKNKNKKRIIKKNKTEMNFKPFSEESNNYQKMSKQILTDIDNIIIKMKNIGKSTLTNDRKNNLSD